MARITLTVEDGPNGTVKIESTPNYAEIIQNEIAGNVMTSAHTYALAMMNRAREVSKLANDKRNDKPLIEIPKVRLAH